MPVRGPVGNVPLDRFDERSLFAQDQTLRLRKREILASFGIGLEACAIRLVGGKTLECDQPPGHVVGSFVRKEIADEVAAAARNDPTPAFRVMSEGVALKRVDLIANDADDGHRVLPVWRCA